MQIFLTILVVSVLALLATSRRLYALRRRRPMIVLISGGWLAILAGAALGPSGAALITHRAVLPMTPLLMVGLGWIGLMVGLQLRRDVLAALPRAVKRLAVWDAAVSLVVFGAIAWAGLWIWVSERGVGWFVGPLALLACGGIGWSMETRSLRARDDPGSQRLALMVRASAALGAVLAVAVFGVAESLGERVSATEMRIDMPEAAIRVGVCVALAIAASVLGRIGLKLAGRTRDDQLVVFLGVVALVAGIGVQFRISPIFSAMLVGIAIANMQGVDVRQFERFILKAEHVVAAMFALLAGVLLNTRIGVPELAIAMSIAAARLLFKPPLFRMWARRVDREQIGSASVGIPADSGLYIGPVRQSPLAIALAVGFVLLEQRSELSTRLLTIVAIAGILSDLIPLGTSIARHGFGRSAGGTARSAHAGWEGVSS